MNHSLVLLWVITLFSYQNSFCQTTSLNVFSKIRQQIFITYQGNVNSDTLDNQVSYLLDIMNSDGSFIDINYQDTSHSNWSPGYHFTRIATFAKAYSNVKSQYYNSPFMLTCITNLMHYWLNITPTPSSTNWYYYTISLPKDIGNTLICLRNSPIGISSSLEQQMLNWMTQGVPIDTAPSNEGSNLIDVAMHYIIRASLTENEALMSETVNIVSKAIIVNDGEGIQADNSFKAHGSQLYMYGYGSVFIRGITSIIQFLQNTSYSINTSKIAIVSNFIRNGFIQSSRGQFTDFNVFNRQITRINAGKADSWAIEQFAKIDLPIYKEYYQKTLNRMKGTTAPNDDDQFRNIHYWNSDYTVHHRPDFMIGIRSVSSRTAKAENGNGENLKGYYLSDGVNYIAVNGNEYNGIYSIWDWSKLPGTTVPSLTNFPLRNAWGTNSGTTSFVGGVSDGIYGVHVYSMNDYNTIAHKAWFMFDREVVCLGANISSNAETVINTTLNQSLLEGDITVKVDNVHQTLPLAKTQHYSDNVQWIHHDSITYFFPDGGDVVIQGQEQSGNMQNINASLSPNIIKKNVFTAWIPHGIKPNKASYAYTIVAGLNDVQAIENYNPNTIKILENSAELQAVEHTLLNIVQIVFYEKGSFNSNKFSVSVDNPCVLLLKDIHTNNITIHAADPSQKLRHILIGFSSSQIQPMRQLKLRLPVENLTGSTISGNINLLSPYYNHQNTEYETFELYPTDDAYVRNGMYSTTNYGDINVMTVKNDGSNYTREIYLKFNPTNHTRPAKRVLLRMYITNANVMANTTSWLLSQSFTTDWSESDIHWNNKPIVNRAITSTQGSNVPSFIEWDITQTFNTLPQNELLTLHISSTNKGSTTDASLGSKEHSNPDYRPVITIEYAPIETISINPSADSWVRSGIHSTKNYGSSETLLVGRQNSDINNAYIKFDLVGYKEKFLDLTLRLYNEAAIHTTWDIKRVNEEMWEEGIGTIDGITTTGITWNNAPIPKDLLTSQTGLSPKGYVNFNLTPVLNILGDSILTIQISSPTDQLSSFASRQNIDVNKRPILLLNTLKKKPRTELSRLPVIEDTYVRNGEFENENYCYDSFLFAQNGTHASAKQEIFLKADLSDVPLEATHITLRLYATFTGTNITTTQWALYSVSHSDWSSTSLNWNNKPIANTYITALHGEKAGNYLEFDITDIVLELRGQNSSNMNLSSYLRSFKLVSLSTNANTSVAFSSIENSNINLRPTIITYNENGLDALPVNLLYFKVKHSTSDLVTLEWATVDEENHHSFEVERSRDGYDFKKIGIVNFASSIIGSKKLYQFNDNQLHNFSTSIVYYRLKQVDIDDTWQYSSIVSTTFQQDIIQYGPNPTTRFVTFDFPTTSTLPVLLTILNLSGKELLRHKLDYKENRIDLGSLPAGLYIGSVEYNNGQKKSIKIVVQ